MKCTMMLLISLAMLVALSSCSSSDSNFVRVMAMDEIIDMENTWQQWKLEHGKQYDPREEAMRRNIFYRKLQDIEEHNAKYPVHVSYIKGLNQFSDLTLEEYRAYNKLRPVTNDTLDGTTFLPPSFVTLPSSVDWRTEGRVTPIKNQGQCGSCWAFSATGSLEGQHAKAAGTLLALSEQQLVDCSVKYHNDGCNGGLMTNAFNYIKSLPGGLETENDYPYTAKDGACRADPSKGVAKVTGYVTVKKYSETDLQNAVATVGPVSVAIDASRASFSDYKTGIYVEPACSTTKLDHAVLVVGYGTQSGQDYWIVKNSWGSRWGMQGYILMARNKNNMCGIATEASYPLV